MNESIISVTELQEKLHDKKIIILDCTLPNQLAKQSIEIQDLQIRNTRFFDIKAKFSNVTDAYPTAYPLVEQFETEAQNLGINRDSQIVVYDVNGIYSAPRVWWLFKSMGHTNVSVLDGGLPEWIKKGHPTEKKTTQRYSKGDFKAKFNQNWVRRFDAVFENVKTKAELVVDVRSQARFLEQVPEPREGLRRGQIPDSVNLPYLNVLNDGKFKTKEELQPIFQFLENEERNIVFSCGSGITACVVLLASEGVIKNNRAVYDGSWTEWGDRVKE